MKTKKKSKGRVTKMERDSLPPLAHSEVVLNEDGHCDEIPRGWIQTWAPKASMDRTGIKCVEVDISNNGYIKLVRVYHPDDRKRVYRREKSGTMIPLIDEVPINKYGNCYGIPYRWIKTDLTQPQLKKLKVPYLLSFKGFTKYGVDIVRCIHPKFEKITLEYQAAKRRK